MKKFIVTTLVVAGLALGAFAQGQLDINNSVNGGYVTLADGSSNYSGPLNIQVWVVSSSLQGVNTVGAAWSAVQADYTSVSAGSLQGTVSTGCGTAYGQSAGVFDYGVINMAGVAYSSSPELALVGYTGASWGASGSLGGIIVFQQPITTAGSTGSLAFPAEPSGWDTEGDTGLALIAAPVPEPATFAMMGLGAAAMLIFRRRS